MKRRKTNKRELIDCRNMAWSWYYSITTPTKALCDIIYDKKTRVNFDYPY